ncbi:MAG: 2-succinyl-5-enolpyruvyl-6-hydroxy-3-cyclohexene-1-carboxylate synthase [Chlamydiae bacterium]|nr:2-succinyl-5-enolpyruvyl-6-hydroxy-3-cyclohexene-1-carboxylate synthase [Chlamydiota bacterium]
MNSLLARHVLEEVGKTGVSEFCICPGGRNAPFVVALRFLTKVKQYHLFEERSAAFFALGRAKALDKPVAVLTTSGTAAAELLPATMEAYYSGVPLLLITADRPRRFRGSGAPQSADQVGLFGKYTIFSEDLAMTEICKIKQWDLSAPAHLNVCFEEGREERGERS